MDLRTAKIAVHFTEDERDLALDFIHALYDMGIVWNSDVGKLPEEVSNRDVTYFSADLKKIFYEFNTFNPGGITWTSELDEVSTKNEIIPAKEFIESELGILFADYEDESESDFEELI